MSELPEGWELVSLIEYVKFLPTGVEKYSGKIEYYSTGSIQDNIHTPEGSFTYEERPSRANRLASLDDVFQARMKETNKGLLITEALSNTLFSTGFLQLRPYENTYNNKLLFYYVRSKLFLDQRDELATGSTQEALTDTKAADIQIPFPPLAEQRRIIAKLEPLLCKVAACEKRLATIPVILKRFRQSVLAAACSGKLTADWREQHPDAETYPVKFELESGVINVEETFPENWRVVNLGTLTTLITSGSRGWAKYYADSGSIFIRAQNINSDILNLADIAFVKLPNHTEGLRTKVRQYDILVTITGANVTKAALVEMPLDSAFVSQHVALVRLADIRISMFLFYTVISLGHGRKQLLNAAYGQGKPGLNLDNIRNLVVGLPPLPEQQEIVRRVEALFVLADQIEARYSKAKAFVDKLTQSVLAKAFRGELVPQDPNDEPASVLLEKIKAEQVINEMKNKRSKKTYK